MIEVSFSQLSLFSMALALCGAIIGVIFYRLYQSRLIRYLPETAPLKMEAFFSESHHLSANQIKAKQRANPSPEVGLVIKVTNTGKESYHFESWFFRALNGRGSIRQLFQFPQNFVRTLRPGESTTIEVLDLTFIEGHTIYTLCLRDIYGREWQLSHQQIENLKKDHFWLSLSE